MRYQQIRNQLTITIVGKGIGGSGESGVGTSPKEKTDEEKAEEAAKKAEKKAKREEERKAKIKRARIKAAAIHISTAAITIGIQSANYAFNGLAIQSGDQNYQDIVTRKYEVVKDFQTIGSATILGAITGARGGTVGAIVGAATSAATASTGVMYKYWNREREYNMTTFKMNNEINYNRARAGINLTNGRLR